MRTYKHITWITSDQFDLPNVLYFTQTEDINHSHYKLSIRNAYEDYKRVSEIGYIDDELVILLCGPIGRILAAEGIDKYPNTTFLCLGSYFDNISNGAQHGYYFSDTLCVGCCPKA